MSGFNEISRMNLADLDRPDSLKELVEDEILEEAEETVAEDGEEKVSLVKEETEKKSDLPEFPIGKHYRADANMSAKLLREFLFRHSYSQPIMIVITLVGIAMAGYGVYGMINGVEKTGMYALAGALIVVGYPLSYLTKGNAMMKSNPAFSHTFHYLFDEWGLHIDVQDQCIDVQWRYVSKVARYGNIAVIYTGKNNGYVLPYADLGSQKDEILAFIDKMRAGTGR